MTNPSESAMRVGYKLQDVKQDFYCVPDLAKVIDEEFTPKLKAEYERGYAQGIKHASEA